MADLKPSDELVAASFSIATVVAVFSAYTAPVNDTKSAPANDQNQNDTRRGALVSAALVSGVALLAKSPTVFVLGAGTILIEAWVRFHANYTQPPSTGN